jgi:multiple sugar transport system ATP-binding protein
MAQVSLKQLTKVYPAKDGPGFEAVRKVSLEIADREFMVLVGPSGCGKSTTLRMIAGLEDITSGTVEIGGRVVNDVHPKDRDIAMVFQNYALYPHMTVRENMAFGLKLRGVPRAEIDARVNEAAVMLGLGSLLDRRPKALSGGQRQRVALGRAIVRKPKVFLFDEPLSNLDAKMRVSTRTEISKLHARLGATMIYVTHDQVEAMTMGDRICVMKDGDIMQVATPLEIYNHPANLFVAGFIGSPPMNLFRGHLRRAGGRVRFVEDSTAPTPLCLDIEGELLRRTEAYIERPVVLGMRPEAIHDALSGSLPPECQRVDVRVEVSEPMGSETLLYLDSGATSFVARVAPTDRFDSGQRVTVAFDMARAHVFDPKTEQAIA